MSVTVLNADFVAVCVLSITIMAAMVYIAIQIATMPAIAFASAQIIAMTLTGLMLLSYLMADQTLYSQSVTVYNSANETLLLLDVALLVLIACRIGRLDSGV